MVVVDMMRVDSIKESIILFNIDSDYELISNYNHKTIKKT